MDAKKMKLQMKGGNSDIVRTTGGPRSSKRIRLRNKKGRIRKVNYLLSFYLFSFSSSNLPKFLHSYRPNVSSNFCKLPTSPSQKHPSTISTFLLPFAHPFLGQLLMMEVVHIHVLHHPFLPHVLQKGISLPHYFRLAESPHFSHHHHSLPSSSPVRHPFLS